MTVISLVQFKDGDARGVAAIDESGAAKRVTGASSTRQLALDAIAAGQGLAAFAAGKLGDAVDLSTVTLLSPIDHEDAAHLLVAGTGLTHLGSAEGRDKMHKAATSGDLTDSMRMFLMGVEGGKSTNPNLTCGVCGETGGDPASIFFYDKVGLDYVSCSPFRVPLARLAAAQAAILHEKEGK